MLVIREMWRRSSACIYIYIYIAGNFISYRCCTQWQARRDNARPDRASESAAFVHQGRVDMNSIQKAHHGPRVSREIKATACCLLFFLLIHFGLVVVVVRSIRWGSTDSRARRLVPRKLRLSLCANLWPAESTQGGFALATGAAAAGATNICTPWSSQIPKTRTFCRQPLTMKSYTSFHMHLECIIRFLVQNYVLLTISTILIIMLVGVILIIKFLKH